ncbi:MAG: hypothetical protein IT258_14980 [Saprospiraceae bacterium]|nr:hypothetical protein [Saprospiraceae bacterium]
MLPNKSYKGKTFRASADDLVATIQTAVQQNELTNEDRNWLIGELDELIEGLKKTKTALANESKKKAA